MAAATIILSSHTHIHQLGLLVLGRRLISISARIFFILHVIVVVWRTKVFSHWGVKNVTNTTMKVVMKLKTIEKPQRWIAFSVFCGSSGDLLGTITGSSVCTEVSGDTGASVCTDVSGDTGASVCTEVSGDTGASVAGVTSEGSGSSQF